jgi:hypothetical protein
MKVALEFASPLGGYNVEWVEVRDLDELRSILRSEKAASCTRYSRCIATDDGHCEAEILPVDSLTQEDLDWVIDTEPTRSRFLLCVRPIVAG